MGLLERWVEYFDELLNNQNIGELEVPPTEDDGQILPPPSLGETVRAVHRLKIIRRQEPMELQPNWLNMEATNYIKWLINLCSRCGTANQCLMTGNEALTAPYIKREISHSAAIIEVSRY